MGGMAAARMTDEIGHVGMWARLARTALRVGSMVAEGLLVAGAIAAVAVVAAPLAGAAVTFGAAFAFLGTTCTGLVVSGVVAGFIGRMTGWNDYKEKKIQEMTEDIGEMEITGVLGIKGAATVFINKLEAMRAVLDASNCSKHPMPEPNKIAEGSDSVFIETGPAARKGDKLMCAAQIVTGSDDVFVGGNKTQYLNIADDKDLWETALEFAPALFGRGSLPGKLGCLGMAVVGNYIGDAAAKGIQWVVGRPVIPMTGGKILDGSGDTDFFLPGPMGIEWARFYSSHDHRSDTIHGKGWSLPYDMELHVVPPSPDTPGSLTFVSRQGRRVNLPWVEPGNAFFNTAEGYIVNCTPGGAYEVVDLDHIRYQFGPVHSGAGTVGTGAQKLRTQRIQDRFNHWIRLRRDALQRLVRITDHLGRIIDLKLHEATGRVTHIELVQGAPGERPGLLASYEYDAHGQLARVIDRAGRVTRRFSYSDGLMIWQVDAAGLEANYAWESTEQAGGPLIEGLAATSLWMTATGRDRRVVRHWTSDGETYDIRYDWLDSDALKAAAGDALPPCGITIAVDQLGRRQEWQWDRLYNLTRYTNPLGESWNLRWSPARELLECTAPGGQNLRFEYDDNGMRTGEIDALERRTRTLWDTNWFEPLAVTLPDGSVWRYEYNNQGLCTATHAPDGTVTEYAYDGDGLLLQIRDGKGGVKKLRHDVRGLLVEYVDCSGQRTQYHYDDIGHLQRVVDALGHTTSLGHSPTGELLTLTLADGTAQSWRYDAAGRLVAHTNAQPRTRHWSYNQRGQLQTQIDEEQRGITLAYDAAQRLSTLVNENGQHFGFQYDAADRMVEETRVGGQRVTVEYDANGWPIAVNHHPSASDLPAGPATGGTLRTQLIRDAVGRLVEKRTAAHHYHYAYGPLDQLTQAQKLAVQQDGSLKPLHTSTFAYDKVGNLIEETATDETTGQTSTLRHSHDALGNRTQTQLPTLLGQPYLQRALNYLHYGSGHLHQINYSQRDTRSADALAVHQLISDIERDALHREIHRTQGQVQTRYALDPLGRRQGAWSQPIDQRSRPYQASDTHWQRAVLSAGTPEQNPFDGLMKAYAYDKVGELRQSRHSLHGDIAHQYDATGRIEHTVRQLFGAGKTPHQAQPAAANNEHFQYDPAGNILDNQAQAALRKRTQHLQEGYVRDNLVRVYEDKRYAYDGHGRLIQKLSGKHTAQTFAWDEESRLIAVTTTRRPGTEHETTQTTRFDYDAIGRRIAKHDRFGTTVFIWEGMRLIEERRGSAVISYVYEPDSYVPLARLDAEGERAEQGGLGSTQDAQQPEASKTIAASAGQISARGPEHQNHPNSQQAANDTLEASYWQALNPKGTGQSTGTDGPSANAKLCEVYYFHTDQVGLPEELSNAQGQIIWQAQYKTWGSTVEERWEARRLHGAKVQGQTEGDVPQEDRQEQNLRFQGQYLDRETGLHYNTFRYYDADIGKFISPDPIGLAGGVNLGSYAPNAISWVDPFGLSGSPVVVIGEGQSAADEAARLLRQQGINAESMRHPKSQWRGGILSPGMPDADFEKAVQWNKDWLKKKIDAGYKVVDIGPDGRTNPSRFYAAELEAVKEKGAAKITLKKFASGETVAGMRQRIGKC